MRAYALLGIYTVLIITAGYFVWPLIHPYMGYVKFWLVSFKQFCHENAVLGYAVYTGLLALILLLGLPFSMAIMLLAGITYDFWEAAMLITGCRLMVAIGGFLLVRHMMDSQTVEHPQPALIKKFDRHPKIGLLLARLAPLPDTTVNMAMGASSLGYMPYIIISLIGMIPLTLICVWVGNELGSITELLKILN